jgi:hypothetical protein
VRPYLKKKKKTIIEKGLVEWLKVYHQKKKKRKKQKAHRGRSVTSQLVGSLANRADR